MALAGLAAAQTNRNSSLTSVLDSQNSSLSLLNGLIQGSSETQRMLNSLSNVTFLAPSNDAVANLIGTGNASSTVLANPGLFEAILLYHILNGTYYASNITNITTFIPTHLTNQSFTNVTGGQVVGAVSNSGNVSFLSALRSESNVERADLNFTGGTIHIIDQVLNIPMNVTDTAVQTNLSASYGAIDRADLGQRIDDLRNITVFAPDNAAFREIASVAGNLSSSVLADILEYHVVQGPIGYSSTLTNSSLTTLNGRDVNITVVNQTVYVNEARVVIPDVLIANGVLHVVDGVLNPNNTQSSNPTNTAPAFSGASSASDVPFTSGVPTATNVATGIQEATSSLETSTSTELAVPMATGAVYMGALFGGAAAIMNGL
ncbi:FAS1 domain-containing protein [Stachybotrys elegans]|uniref:FAS1 domain-containing protein n=1 Tax=Stachybotrys elegans TaxID=80388 RepID=A0A8K0SWV9_9HYPO|nr:FAS1 domain-containing protein [Stachybotrys elegans]